MRRGHDLALVELHVRDAVHQQAAGAVVALEHGHEVTGPVQLRRGGETRRPGADHRDLLAGARRAAAAAATQPSSKPRSMICALDVLDRDRRLVDAEHARALAGRRADAPGELREVVRHVQPLERLAPQPAVDEVVPLRDQVVDRAARGHAARSACRCGRTARRSPCSARPAGAAASPRGADGTRPSRARARPATRSTGSSRRYSMNPVGLPIVAVPQLPPTRARSCAFSLEGHHDRFLAREPLFLGARDGGEHALVVLRDHLDEARRPSPSQSASSCFARVARGVVAGGSRSSAGQPSISVGVLEPVEADHLHVHARSELAVLRRARRRCRPTSRRRSCGRSRPARPRDRRSCTRSRGRRRPRRPR